MTDGHPDLPKRHTCRRGKHGARGGSPRRDAERSVGRTEPLPPRRGSAVESGSSAGTGRRRERGGGCRGATRKGRGLKKGPGSVRSSAGKDPGTVPIPLKTGPLFLRSNGPEDRMRRRTPTTPIHDPRTDAFPRRGPPGTSFNHPQISSAVVDLIRRLFGRSSASQIARVGRKPSVRNPTPIPFLPLRPPPLLHRIERRPRKGGPSGSMGNKAPLITRTPNRRTHVGELRPSSPPAGCICFYGVHLDGTSPTLPQESRADPRVQLQTAWVWSDGHGTSRSFAVAFALRTHRFARDMASRALRTVASRVQHAMSTARTMSSSANVGGLPVQVYQPEGKHRVVVTKHLPGTRWLDVLVSNGCRVEVCTSTKTILDVEDIQKLMGTHCDGVIGQLTEDWGPTLFQSLREAGGKAYSNYAVGYNNVDVGAATNNGIPVGNTPGVLTETTAEIAASLTLAAARRIVEADTFMRNGHYKGWLPDLFVGKLLQNKTVGIIGAGRIGTAYAKMMVEGHKMDLVYFNPIPAESLENYMEGYGKFLESQGEKPVTCRRVDTVEELLEVSDVVSLHCLLDKTTTHLMNAERLNMMKRDAVLVNSSRGPVVDETALVAHLKANPEFRCGLDVFEDEPAMKPGLADCPNAVILPHIASASLWTRGGMATLAACNVAGLLQHYPVYNSQDVLPFVDGPFAQLPKACPSIVNAKELGL